MHAYALVQAIKIQKVKRYPTFTIELKSLSPNGEKLGN